jgi:hypothetical protein
VVITTTPLMKLPITRRKTALSNAATICAAVCAAASMTRALSLPDAGVDPLPLAENRRSVLWRRCSGVAGRDHTAAWWGHGILAHNLVKITALGNS